MTIFAVMCAGMFPLLHLGRPWIFYWLLPYPNTMTVQPQFRSPLVWDVFAVSTYATVSLLFWYLGMIPDLASLRDRAKSRFAVWFLRRALPSVARSIAALAMARDGLVCCWPVSQRRWFSRCIRSSASISRSRFCPDGIRRFFRRISWPAPSIPASPWCWFSHPAAQGLRTQNLITERHLNNCAKADARDRTDSRLHLPDRTVHSLVQRQQF